MSPLRSSLPVLAALLPALAIAADFAVVSLAEGHLRVLRGATWYKVVAGARLEPADIVGAGDKTQMFIELANGTRTSLVGPGTLFLEARPVKGGTAGDALLLTLPAGWLKVAAKPPGVRLRAPPAELTITEGVLVLRSQGAALEAFVEAGQARLVELLPNGNPGPVRDARQNEYWSNGSGRFVATRAPSAFVGTMPRHFQDPLPSLADRYKAKPTLVAEGEITYAEAEPWLASRDRAMFEKRFAGRLRDPVFRRAVEPNVARYPSWDRMLHPEKYLPKPVPVPVPAQ